MAQNDSQIITALGRGRVKQKEPLARYATYRLGGPADLFYVAKTTEELVKAIKLARKLAMPYFLLGGGSNLLVSGQGFRGMVIKVENSKLEVKGEKILAEAGVPLKKLIQVATENSLTGLEFAVGIPGTVGGAVRGNAGAWQESLGNKVVRVKIMNEKGEIKWIDVQKCDFTYRQSRFKKTKEVILAAELGLKRGSKAEIEAKIKFNQAKRANQPKEPSAGCVFINPKPRSAGQMIDQCGLKGRQIGGAQISLQHANFIINTGQAKANDIFQLIKLAKRTVKEKFGVALEIEIVLLGFDKIGERKNG